MIETFGLYNREIELTFNDASHRYKVAFKNGRSFHPDSVTRICSVLDKPALIPWAINATIDFIRTGIQPGIEHAESYLEEVYQLAKKESQRKKGEAAARGSLVHDILAGVERPIQGTDDERNRSIESKVVRAQEWLKQNNVSLTSVERPIYSRRYRYSGRLDGVGVCQGVSSLFDWKTGKGIYPEFRLQTAAYVKAFEEEFPDQPIQQRIILHLTEDACIPHFYPRSLLRNDFNAFLGAQKLFQQIRTIEKQEKKSRS